MSAPEPYVPIDTPVAILSDVHGNARALRAVLDELKRRDVKRLYVLGDHLVGGEAPLETWKMLMDARAKLVRGLGDTALASLVPEKLVATTDDERAKVERFVRTRKEVGELVLRHLLALPYAIRVPLADGRELLLTHGAPSDPTTEITHDLDDEEMLALVASDPADIVATSGGHVSFERDLGDVRVIGVGSVGESPEAGHAHFALVTPGYEGTVIEHAHVPIDG
ncbi:MAG: metallophosphoesterase family protein [Sandaracinus sp.]